MKRYVHGINCQWTNAGKFFQLIPSFYHEVAPGETLSGKIQTRLWSDTLNKPVLNRTYFDTYAFYIPFRLLWDEFPDFIKDEESGLTVPQVTDKFSHNFENDFTLGADGVAAASANTAWLRYAYNLVYNKFFLSAGGSERTETDNSVATVFVRPSTLHESVRLNTDIDSVPIPTGNIDDLRQAFASDRFKKLRGWYGDKYTDYLSALGVEASWSILDEPEMVAQKHADLPMRTSQSTTDNTENNVGDPAGYFDGVNTIPVRRTFCPEHGLFAVYTVAKMDTWNVNGHNCFTLNKAKHEKYWTPEFNAETQEEWDRQLWYGDSVNNVSPYRLTKWEDYRKGQNCVGIQKSFGLPGYLATYNKNEAFGADGYRRRAPDDYDGLFGQYLYDGTSQGHYQITTKVQMRKQSPVPKGRSQVY